MAATVSLSIVGIRAGESAAEGPARRRLPSRLDVLYSLFPTRSYLQIAQDLDDYLEMAKLRLKLRKDLPQKQVGGKDGWREGG